MPINMNVETLNLNSIVGKDRYSGWVEQDVLVPDSKPDVMKVVKVEAMPLLTDIQVMDKSLKVSGEIVYYILYNSMDGGKTRGISVTYPIAQTIMIDYLDKDMMSDVKLAVKNIIFSVPNERKITIKTELVYDYIITRNKQVKLINSLEDETIQYKTMQSIFNNIIDIRKDKIDVNEEILLPEEKRGVDEILKVKYNVVNEDYKVSYNKILVKGDLDIKVLYLTEGLEDAELFEAQVPFSGMVEFENISDSYKFSVSYRLNRLDVISTSERSMQISADINVMATMYEEKETSYITDFYSTNKKLKYDTSTVSAVRKPKTIEKSFNIKEMVGLIDNPDDYKVIDFDLDLSGLENKINNGILYLSGNIEANILLENKKTKMLENKNYQIVFDNTVALNEDVKPENISVDYILSSPNVYFDKANIIVSFIINMVTRIEDEFTVSQAQEIYSEPIDEEDFNSMYIYIVKKGDTLWDIAKKYKTTVSKIANINNIENENNINIGQKLLLIR